MQPLLDCRNINYSYHAPAGETYALSDVTFQVNDGEFAVIVGPSGCGKSTLLSLICRLYQPESGSILLNGKPLEEHADFHIGYMPQKDQLFEWRNIYGNITLGLEIQRKLTQENLQFAEQLMKEYGLWEFRHVKPSQLSGGMRQRAALIRTLALRPSLLLLDEPFSALDYQTRLMVADDIYKIIKKEHKTAILVTHDLAEAVSMADKVIVLCARPAHVIREMPVVFDLADRTPMKSRNAPQFHDYFNEIWKELNTYGKEE